MARSPLGRRCPGSQQGALDWCIDVAGLRSHRSLDGATPLSVFTSTENRQCIAQLPVAPFELTTWCHPKIGPDCYAKAGKALYTIPWRFIGQHVDARIGERTVEFYVDATIVKTWAKDREGQTDRLG